MSCGVITFAGPVALFAAATASDSRLVSGFALAALSFLPGRVEGYFMLGVLIPFFVVAALGVNECHPVVGASSA